MIELGSVQYEETRGAFRSDFLKDELTLSKESPNELMREKNDCYNTNLIRIKDQK